MIIKTAVLAVFIVGGKFMKGLYIHIPFCVRKCEYCDFVSYSGMESRIDEYLDALSTEAAQRGGIRVDTVFIGGGTPTILNAEQITRLCGIVRNNFELSSGAEWTAEANPGTVTDRKIYAMLEGGINRISAGVQSFSDRELRAAGRIHDAEAAYNTVISLSKNGFRNISIDLMASLPCQTPETFAESLRIAAELPLEHISVYSLIIEEGTPIKKKYDEGIYSEPDEDTDRELYSYTKGFLESKGFYRYEISNYARQGYESRHNMLYWTCGEYIGLGAAAHSYTGVERYFNTSDINRYISGSFSDGVRERLTKRDMMGEFMMLGLRMTRGVVADEFFKRFGCRIADVFGTEIKKHVSAGLLEYDGKVCRLTERGLDLANTVMCDFI